ncbi:MAG: hypothetical protein US57_C0003G0033 [Candidatus Moranbacteria bacterium GW2011_GWC2_37_73]|nr:MAG: hypothetical protein UR95_C0003G0026 [Parcubacteria group bacterium GW2011_GWC1_36_108]KKQ01271.1 MAG: hypothetical protein US09_C0001G0031 [Candidatus Moranbacteria bacterium GW2011_GWD1_36_198]KKQ02330.1 MAG: hypothetical protein US10_C0003G0031 [Candidatus Moranbacteria bacterium GW2011_GWD2_36_198]KKQ40225.1 MAG: hypothetical protein US57_C0003G0033 [Candidatus Moranbacteria bacterium GW2011_GWC2_37_73]HAR99725.1 hypothetical protein [Candidatus Moranbacteria bacterium]
MFDFIFSQTILYLTLILVLFVPGFFLILGTRMHKEFSLLELFVLSFGSSIALIDFLVIILGKSPLGITRNSIVGGIVLFSVICLTVYFIFNKKNNSEPSIPAPAISSSRIKKHSTILVITLLLLTIFIKTIYFKDAIFPTSTDLGHHMYWTKVIAVTGELPKYEKVEIQEDFTLEEPSPIADFIIGEHLPFAAIAIISSASVISAFPAITLFLIHLMSVLAIFVLTQALFKNSKHQNAIATATLFLVGPLWAIASPQAKFASGGVIGNNIGNLLIPLIILLFLKALIEKKSKILAYALFLSFGLAYTHHLSTFVFAFIFFFTIIAYAIINPKTLLQDAKGWMKLIISPWVLGVLTAGIIFIFFLYTPTYLNTTAIDTAVGAPSKATRTGLTFDQFKSTAGEARFAFALLGIVILFFARSLGKYNQAFLIGWIVALTIMSLRPNWLFVDIPSNRVASYIVFPITIIAAYALIKILTALKSEGKNYLNPIFLLATFFIFLSFIATSGLYDNALALNDASSANKALQTYNASEYITKRSDAKDMILKDHNYLAGDSWIKLFTMRGYSYPLSRGYFKRYEDETKPREQCTNFMISTPTAKEAKQCYDGTGTDFIMINPKIDSSQFSRLKEFWQVYSADDIGIFYKAN